MINGTVDSFSLLSMYLGRNNGTRSNSLMIGSLELSKPRKTGQKLRALKPITLSYVKKTYTGSSMKKTLQSNHNMPNEQRWVTVHSTDKLQIGIPKTLKFPSRQILMSLGIPETQ